MPSMTSLRGMLLNAHDNRDSHAVSRERTMRTNLSSFRSLSVNPVLGLGLGLVWLSLVMSTVVEASTEELTLRFGFAGQVITPPEATDSVWVSEGTALRFNNVTSVDGTQVDAVVTFVDGLNLGDASLSNPRPDRQGKMRRIDYPPENSSSDASLQHSVEVMDPNDPAFVGNADLGWAELRIDFFEGGTETPFALSGLTFNIYDLDNKQVFEIGGIATYSLSNNTHLNVSQIGEIYRFSSPNEDTSESDGTSYTVGRVKILMQTTSSMTYKAYFPQDARGTQDLDFSPGLPWTGATEEEVPVGKANQAALVAVATPANIAFNGTSALSTTGGSGTGAVSFAVTTGTEFCSISGTTLTGTGVGTCTVTATKAADDDYNEATSETISVEVLLTTASGTALDVTMDSSSSCVGFGAADFLGSPANPLTADTMSEMFEFEALACGLGGSVKINLVLADEVPDGTQVWKWNGTAWATLESIGVTVTTNGNTISYTLIDGGVGDLDGEANGRIIDPVAISIPAPGPEPLPIPVLGPAGLLLLSIMLGWLGLLGQAQRKRTFGHPH